MQVNPYAKLTDWEFGLIATAMVSNVVLIAAIGESFYNYR